MFRHRNNSTIVMLTSIFCLTLVNFGCGAKYKWTKTDWALAGVFVAAQAADGYTTDRIINDNNGYEKYRWAMGGEKHPNTEQIILWKGVQTVLVIGAAHVAPIINPKLRKAILIGCTISAGYCTWHNWDLLNE